MNPTAWYDKATGAFYLSLAGMRQDVLARITPLYERPK